MLVKFFKFLAIILIFNFLSIWIRKLILRIVSGRLTNVQFQYEIKMFYLIVAYFNKIELYVQHILL